MSESTRDPKTKAGAVAFVSAVIRDANALYSVDFNVAMDLSRKFDISAADVLEWRRERIGRATNAKLNGLTKTTRPG